ncbi:hypothetical protein RI367_008767 [Sorochytrium milnesiophthora]
MDVKPMWWFAALRRRKPDIMVSWSHFLAELRHNYGSINPAEETNRAARRLRQEHMPGTEYIRYWRRNIAGTTYDTSALIDMFRDSLNPDHQMPRTNMPLATEVQVVEEQVRQAEDQLRNRTRIQDTPFKDPGTRRTRPNQIPDATRLTAKVLPNHRHPLGL